MIAIDNAASLSYMQSARKKPLTGIDLFSGAGGMSIGAQWAGIHTAVAIESDPFAAATYSLNHPESNVICQDIRKVQDFNTTKRSRPFIAFGGPPCQGFSTSNQKTRTSENPHNWLFTEYLRAVKTLAPEWVLFENVKGLLETEGGYFFQQVLDGLEDLEYTTSHFVLNAKDFGVPQNRSRLFVIGSRKGKSVKPPKPLAGKAVTVDEAIADLPDLENGASMDMMPYKKKRGSSSRYACLLRGKLNECGNHLVSRNAPIVIERYKHIPQGGNWEDIPLELMLNYADRNRCHTGIYHRLRGDEPSIVIGNYRKMMLVHPYQNRGLSVREAARLQSFPDWFTFRGSIGFQQQQVGNAVPPLLAKVVFETIINGI